MLIRTNGVKDGFPIKEMNRTATLLLLSSLSIKDNRVTNHKHFLLCLPNLFQQKAQLCGILRQGPPKKWREHPITFFMNRIDANSRPFRATTCTTVLFV